MYKKGDYITQTRRQREQRRGYAHNKRVLLDADRIDKKARRAKKKKKDRQVKMTGKKTRRPDVELMILRQTKMNMWNA